MLEIIIINLLGGAALGLRFKALVLLPATIVSCVAAVVFDFAMRGGGPAFGFWAISSAALALQLGYLVGATIAEGLGRRAAGSARFDTVRACVAHSPFIDPTPTTLTVGHGRLNLLPVCAVVEPAKSSQKGPSAPLG